MLDGDDGGVRSEGDALVVDAAAAAWGKYHAVELTEPVAQELVVMVAGIALEAIHSTVRSSVQIVQGCAVYLQMEPGQYVMELALEAHYRQVVRSRSLALAETVRASSPPRHLPLPVRYSHGQR